nr:hypothetical protein [Mesorhizobium sp. M00.F.Ca.ET.216.01.1.1]
MRQIDRFPFVFALVLYLLAWFLGLPVRARSAPLREVECALVLPGSRYETIGYAEGIKTRTTFLENLPNLIK